MKIAADGPRSPATLAERFIAQGKALLPELVTLRRAIHAEPELGLHLPETQRRVLEALAPLSPEALAKVETELPRVVARIAEAHSATATAEITTGYPSVVNDQATTERALEALRPVFGGRVVTAPHPTMGAEDFSYVAQHVPATMLMLLASPPGLDEAPAPNHSPHAVFDDAVLGDQAAALALLAAQTLTAHARGGAS